MSLVESSQSVPPYKVVSQVPQLVQTPDGRYVQGYRVTAQFTGTGTTFYVDVPMGQYTPATVRALLQSHGAQVAEVDQIGQ